MLFRSSLDGIPLDDQPFDKFVGDPASRQGVTLAVRPFTVKPVGNSFYTQEITATVGNAAPEVVLEFGLFVIDTL